MEKINLPEHIAIILDGNRRWARERGLPDKLGHKEGAENLKRIAKYANKIGIKYLTVYTFSTENWKRSEEEVSALMMLLKVYVNEFIKSTTNDNVKINILGDISVLQKDLQECIIKAMEKSKNNTGLTLNLAFNYGGRDEITKAVKKIAQKVKNNEINIEDINEDLVSNNLYTEGQPDPDLLIRPGGEKRLSNYLPWQLAYTELVFVDKYWPEFSNEDLDDAIKVYSGRNRRFGGNK